MRLIDSNVLINAADKMPILKVHLNKKDLYISEISKLEVLGYPDLKQKERLYFESLFLMLDILPIDSDVIEEAINLKRKRKIGACDAIIAATALLYNLELATFNVKDFEKIEGLNVINPIS
jgi:toxin FitB